MRIEMWVLIPKLTLFMILTLLLSGAEGLVLIFFSNLDRNIQVCLVVFFLLFSHANTWKAPVMKDHLKEKKKKRSILGGISCSLLPITKTQE